jgi:predicted acylesterase/phospholipase RssA
MRHIAGLELKRVLLFVSEDRQVSDLLALFSHVPGCEVRESDGAPFIVYRGIGIRLVVAHDKHDALSQLHHGYFNIVLLDLRSMSGDDSEVEHAARRGTRLTASMDHEADIETRYGFHRILALVGTNDEDRADQLIADFARQGLGRIVRDRTPRPVPSGTVHEKGVHFALMLLDEMRHRMMDRRPGRNAMCAAGGGITGLYFEMGVLKCLDDCIGPRGVNGFDDYYGISAGAIISALLANGYSADEGMAAILQRDEGRLGPLNLSLMRLSHINFPEMYSRLRMTARDMARLLWRNVRARTPISAESILLRYSDMLIPPFHGESFERLLRGVFCHPGSTNDFRQLQQKLYIGVTDQDTKTHVVFGSHGFDDIPISKAIQASFAINPAFTAARINGRYYEDGAVTRTSNFSDAIEHGADLLFIVDPFVPYVSKEAGYNHKKGLFYHIDQDVRTMSYTRFERARIEALRKHPEVSSYTFLPANRLRKLMSINPMDHRPFLKIWRGAYLSTLHRVHALRYRMAGDLSVHRMTLQTDRADAVAEQLRRAEDPSFEDFFPDRKVQVKMLPLATERRAPKPAEVSRIGSVFAAVGAAQ